MHCRKGTRVFEADQMDGKGGLPAPFNLEKFNFNPFELQGSFSFQDKDDPCSFEKAFKSGRFLDKLNR